MISSFAGKFDFLSNFYPCKVVYDGDEYKSVEHAYQAAKTLDKRLRYVIGKAYCGGAAKRLGREVVIRPDWEEIKVSIMADLVRKKFKNDVELALQLLNTGDEGLEEGNTWGDRFWGVYKGRGENNLGKILMSVREEIRKDIE